LGLFSLCYYLTLYGTCTIKSTEKQNISFALSGDGFLFYPRDKTTHFGNEPRLEVISFAGRPGEP
jgi:hypothetical protein